MARSFAEVAAGAVVLAVAAGFVVYAAAHTGHGSAGGGYELRADFSSIDGLAPGADVRVAGVKVGNVLATSIDPNTYEAQVTLSVRKGLQLPTDTSAQIASEGLLGGEYLALVPGGADKMLQPGQQITITQSAISLQDLLGKFIFGVSDLASAVEKTLPKDKSGAKDKTGQKSSGDLP